jgi:hypothetical protein
MDFGTMHSRSMAKVFDGLESLLTATRGGEEEAQP